MIERQGHIVELQSIHGVAALIVLIGLSMVHAEMPGYVHLSDEHTEANASRKDSKFSQIVRNLKSHKNTKSNFIYQGFAQDVAGGSKITRKGLDFVREYFRN